MGLLSQIGRPSHDRFAHAVLPKLEAGGMDDLVYDKDLFALVSRDSGRRVLLGNIYIHYCNAAPWERRRVLTGFASAIVATQSQGEMTGEQARQRLRPAIRERIMLEDIRLGSPDTPSVPFRVVGEHLSFSLVLDHPETMQQVRGDDLDKWGLTFDIAAEIAQENLRRVSLPPRFKQVGLGLFFSDWHDDYDTARILVSEAVSALKVRGRPVVMVPDRSTLIAAGSDDPAALVAMAGMVAQAQKQRPACGIAFRLDDRWTPFVPPPGHPAYLAFMQLFRTTMAGYYEQQKETLERHLRESGRDIFVATYNLMQPVGSDEYQSIAVWGKGVDTLLPETDVVTFFEKGREPIDATWESVAATLGLLMEKQDYYPVRYRVRSYPAREQLAALTPP